MINYFEAAEKTLRARGLLETALGNLERKKERILRYGAPSEYPSADMSKPYTGAKSVNDALADCLELAEVMREIQVTRDTPIPLSMSAYTKTGAMSRATRRRPEAFASRRQSTARTRRRARRRHISRTSFTLSPTAGSSVSSRSAPWKM